MRNSNTSNMSSNMMGGGNNTGNNVGLQRKKKRRVMLRRKRTLDPSVIIDYKSPEILKRFITDRGKIIPRRISGATQAQQRQITLAIKRARFLSLLPSAISHESERGFAGEMQTVAVSFSSTFRSRSPRPMGAGEGRGPHGGGHHDDRGGDGRGDRGESRDHRDGGEVRAPRIIPVKKEPKETKETN